MKNGSVIDFGLGISLVMSTRSTVRNVTASDNTSNDNDGDGIEATSPTTITHNTALDNGGLPINPPSSGNGCVILHNTTSDGDDCSASDSTLAGVC